MKKSAFVLLTLLAAGFVAGLIHLFQLRFEAGDVYPAYSSLRADPLGTKALYDSLDELVLVRRNFESLTRLGDGRDQTLLYLGGTPEDARFTDDQFKVFDTFLRSGGRLVVAFHPVYVAPRWNRFAGKPGPVTAPPPALGTNQVPPRVRRNADPLADYRTTAIPDRWNFDFGHAPLNRAADSTFLPATAVRRTEDSLPDQLAIHSALYFQSLDDDWRVLFSRREGTNDYPVLVERPFGRGSLVLAADSYPFSNEALRQSREPRLLTWYLGGNSQAVFEETHLGTQNDPGIAAMARRYHLHALAVALLILAALFIWRNSVAFLPPDAEQLADEAAHQISGKDAGEGFINLLRRNVPPVELLKVCLEQWNASAGAGQKPAPWKLEAMQKLIDEQNALDPRQRNPVRTYQQFCAILSKRT